LLFLLAPIPIPPSLQLLPLLAGQLLRVLGLLFQLAPQPSILHLHPVVLLLPLLLPAGTLLVQRVVAPTVPAASLAAGVSPLNPHPAAAPSCGEAGWTPPDPLPALRVRHLLLLLLLLLPLLLLVHLLVPPLQRERHS
jgi:hypothetical protein